MKNHIYILDTNLLASIGTFDMWYRKMSVERRKKIDAFYFFKDKCLSLGAGILLSNGLFREEITDTELSYGENGKPFLCGRDDIYFNISHSEKMVICAFSDRPVGADIEAYRHFDDDLANFVYHESEIRQICSSGIDADIGFTQLWTIKESIMKYFGTGLNGRIDFIGRNDGQVKVRGFRIELTEVEGVIREFEGIKDATVQAFEDEETGESISQHIS